MCVGLCAGCAWFPAPPGSGCSAGGCAWAWVSAAPHHSWLGCWGLCVFVCALRLYPSTPGWGIWCGCACLGSSFGCAPPLMAGVLGIVCVGVRAPLVPCHSWRGCVCVCGSGFNVHSAFCWLGCWGAWPLACTASVSRYLLVGLPVGWGCAGVAVGGVLPPPSPFVFFSHSDCGGGGGFGPVVSWCFLVSAAACPRLGSLGLRPPFPSRLGCAYIFFLPITASLGCVSACPGRVSGCPLPPAGCRRFWQGGPLVFFRGGPWVPPSVPSGWGVCVVVARPLGCVSVSCSPPPYLCCLFVSLFFSEGWVCLFLPLPFLGWCKHWLAFGVVNRIAVGAHGLLGSAPAPWLRWVMYTLGPGLFCWIRFWLCRLGGCARLFHEALG